MLPASTPQHHKQGPRHDCSNRAFAVTSSPCKEGRPMDVLQALWTNAMDYYNNQRLNTTLAIFSLLYLATFYIDRLICLDKCLRDDAQPRDIRNATVFLLVIFFWCVFCFLVLRFAAGLSYLLCLAVFFRRLGSPHSADWPPPSAKGRRSRKETRAFLRLVFSKRIIARHSRRTIDLSCPISAERRKSCYNP